MKPFKPLWLAAVIISIFFSCNGHKSNVAQNIRRASSQDTLSGVIERPSQSYVLLFDFDDNKLDTLPAGWSQYYNGNGGTDWRVIDYEGNGVLAQLQGDNPNNHFNIVVYDSLQAKDVDLTVQMLAIRGHYDQGGGLIWRFSDKDNYYIVRANPLENNVVLYRVKNGHRRDLPILGKGRTYGTKVPDMGKGWHTIRLTAKGDTFTVFFNGRELFKVVDSTFRKSGKIGLWTKADAVTYFDSLKVRLLP